MSHLHNAHTVYNICIQYYFSLMMVAQQAGFLSVWFVSGLGMILYNTGMLIRFVKDNDDSITRNVEIPDWYSLEFAGAFLALLFWVGVFL